MSVATPTPKGTMVLCCGLPAASCKSATLLVLCAQDTAGWSAMMLLLATMLLAVLESE